MAIQTTNYNLVKPLGKEKVDIDVINANMDAIDTALKGLDDSKVSLANNLTTTEDGFALDATQGKVLADRVSNAIMKDGSVQMTGVLKTKGANSQEMINGLNGIVSYNDDYYLCSNCYFDGANWRYSSAGKASQIKFSGTTGKAVYIQFLTGVKDGILSQDTSVTGDLLTAKTGLPLTGGTLTGALNFGDTTAKILRSGLVMDMLYGTANLRFNSTSGVNGIVIRDVGTGAEHKIYGQHNVTRGTAAPAGGSDGDIYLQYT